MTKLKPEKITFQLAGSNNKKIQDIIKDIKKEHDVTITKTAILNIAVNEFFYTLEETGDNMEDYLIRYNEL